MPTLSFNRNSMARWYATQHLATDPGVVAVWHLPKYADDREIRLVELNSLLVDRGQDCLQPIDFGVDRGMDSEHRLFILDVTPAQWEKIRQRQLALPGNWSLEEAQELR